MHEIMVITARAVSRGNFRCRAHWVCCPNQRCLIGASKRVREWPRLAGQFEFEEAGSYPATLYNWNLKPLTENRYLLDRTE